MVHKSSSKMRDITEYQQIWILLTDFNGSLLYKIAKKSIQWGAELLHADDGQK
jgi:hypothetical protein